MWPSANTRLQKVDFQQSIDLRVCERRATKQPMVEGSATALQS